MMQAGDVVKLKSSTQLFTINYLNGAIVNCSCIDEHGNEINSNLRKDVLEIVSLDEIKKIHKSDKRRKDAQSGASWADKAAKIAAVISAIGVALLTIFTAYQTSKITNLEGKIDKLIQSAKIK